MENKGAGWIKGAVILRKGKIFVAAIKRFIFVLNYKNCRDEINSN